VKANTRTEESRMTSLVELRQVPTVLFFAFRRKFADALKSLKSYVHCVQKKHPLRFSSISP